MEDKLCFVQFIHPGGEHRPDDGDIKHWNMGEHKRKFLKTPGRYVDGKKLNSGDIVFWGEWEPESRVIRTIDKPLRGGPRFIFHPYYAVPACYVGLQNTDPFVFGNQFHYTWCLQDSSPTLRHLARGSIILFGSCEDRKHFVLDTVFVVDRGIDHNRDNYQQVLAEKISREYQEVTVTPRYHKTSLSLQAHSGCGAPSHGKHRAETVRLYFGATFEKPANGMFSFFPCLPFAAASNGFARPRIRLGSKITQTLNQWINYEGPLDRDEITGLWQKVVDQITTQHLALGTYAELPERRLVRATENQIRKAVKVGGC